VASALASSVGASRRRCPRRMRVGRRRSTTRPRRETRRRGSDAEDPCGEGRPGESGGRRRRVRYPGTQTPNVTIRAASPFRRRMARGADARGPHQRWGGNQSSPAERRCPPVTRDGRCGPVGTDGTVACLWPVAGSPSAGKAQRGPATPSEQPFCVCPREDSNLRTRLRWPGGFRHEGAGQAPCRTRSRSLLPCSSQRLPGPGLSRRCPSSACSGEQGSATDVPGWSGGR